MACSIAGEGKRGAVYTLGPIIHNEEVVADLARRDVVSVSLPELKDLPPGTIIIRSHGVSRDVLQQIHSFLDESGQPKFLIEDATCPFVKKIHRIVEEKSKSGYQILVIGDINHPEVQATKGWSSSIYYR